MLWEPSREQIFDGLCIYNAAAAFYCLCHERRWELYKSRQIDAANAQRRRLSWVCTCATKISAFLIEQVVKCTEKSISLFSWTASKLQMLYLREGDAQSLAWGVGGLAVGEIGLLGVGLLGVGLLLMKPFSRFYIKRCRYAGWFVLTNTSVAGIGMILQLLFYPVSGKCC